jgi:hypothetical protein
MSQAGFIERWCFNNVLAEVSSGADGSAVVRVHVPPLNVVTVPVATLSSIVLSGPLLACYACCLWLRLPWVAVRGLCSFAFRALVSSCSAVCPLCWLPRRLVYVRHVRILDSKKRHRHHTLSPRPSQKIAQLQYSQAEVKVFLSCM